MTSIVSRPRLCSTNYIACHCVLRAIIILMWSREGNIPTHARTHTHTHTRAPTHTHTHTHTCTRTHTNTHTIILHVRSYGARRTVIGTLLCFLVEVIPRIVGIGPVHLPWVYRVPVTEFSVITVPVYRTWFVIWFTVKMWPDLPKCALNVCTQFQYSLFATTWWTQQ